MYIIKHIQSLVNMYVLLMKNIYCFFFYLLTFCLQCFLRTYVYVIQPLITLSPPIDRMLFYIIICFISVFDFIRPFSLCFFVVVVCPVSTGIACSWYFQGFVNSTGPQAIYSLNLNNSGNVSSHISIRK